MTTQRPQVRTYRRASLLSAAAVTTSLFLGLLLAPIAQAVPSKQPVDFFGGSGAIGGRFAGATEGVAVNQHGAGVGNTGDIYVTDTLNNRIERFARDDHGTPADGSDDTYSFVSAWGVDVEPANGTGYQICTAAEQCSEAIGSGIAGGLSKPAGISIDEDTGDVYVADPGNARVDVFTGDGVFLRAFGFDVIATGPDDAGTGYEVCVPGNGDVCKAGVPGSGPGQVGGPIIPGAGFEMGIAVSQPDGDPASGTVFLADRLNSRVNTYHLDGSAPASIGSASVFSSGKFNEAPRSVAVDSRGILYATNRTNDGEVERYDTEDSDGGGIGFLAPITSGVNEVQKVTVDATGGTFNLTYDGETTVDLPFDAPARDLKSQEGPGTPGVTDTVAEALAALPVLAGADPGGGERQIDVFGGPGGANGTSPYQIEFKNGLGARDVEQVTASNGAIPLSGGSGVSATTLTQGQPGLVPGLTFVESVAVEPDSDGGGPDQDTLYVQRTSGQSHVIQQFGPLNAPGLTAPPTNFDAIHGTASNAYAFPPALAIDEASGRIYVPSEGEAGVGIYVLDNSGPRPDPSATLDSLSDVTATSVTAHATITPNGRPPLKYHLEYSADGSHWESGPTVALGTQSTPQSVTAELSPPGGLEPNTLYHVRLFAKRPFFQAITTPELTFTTLSSPPLVETTGSPVRSTTTVRLDGRLSPEGSPTTYHFEYGTEGPCDSNPCTSAQAHPAGSGGEFELVSQPLEGLEPNTTYHYRLVADNGNPGSPVFGEDMTVSTFANEEPLSHGHFAGPVGSDRAWELVSEPDTSGNPAGGLFAPSAASISDDGNRAVYGVSGGTPLSETGTFATRLFAERTSHGWETRKIFPSRQLATGAVWRSPGGPGDLSTMVVQNNSQVKTGRFGIWKLSPDGAPVELFSSAEGLDLGSYLGVSDDGSRVLKTLMGTQDPAHPIVGSGIENLYDISSGPPRLINLLPDGTVPPCGVVIDELKELRSARWLLPDGSQAFFEARGSNCGVHRIYARNFSTETTTLVSGAPYSGSLCDSNFIKSTAGSVYFFTESRLTADDVEPEGCKSAGNGSYGDIYRYDLGNGGLHCLTCLAPGYPTAVNVHLENGGIRFSVGVAEGGSRIYFVSNRRLIPGAPTSGGTYGLDVGSGKLVYVGASEFISDNGESTMNPGGSVVAFRSNAPRLNAVGGQQNGGTFQDYLFNFADRSLVCVSCPSDGSLPIGAVRKLEGPTERGAGPNASQPLDASGEDFIFSTPMPMVPADQNTARAGQDVTAGTDVYEWRDGKVLLVSDGITNWPSGEVPDIAGITPSGHDVFFTEAAQLTPDALDGYNRLYDARIGGGFEFPPPPKPCPLEVCQGTPKGAPEEQAPGTAYLQGAANATQKPSEGRCPKAKVRRKGRCVGRRPKHTKKPAQHKRAKHNNRRAGR